MTLGTRTLILLRHGQYDLESGGRLTALGREQAALAAAWLKNREPKVHAVWSSTLPRARETAVPVAALLRGGAVKATGVLREGMYSRIKGFHVTVEERDHDRARADLAYAKFFRTSRTDRVEILVCHGNLIRYLVCRAMDVPVARWTRLNSNHCGMTRILVRGTGAVRVVAYNETGHLPRAMTT